MPALLLLLALAAYAEDGPAADEAVPVAPTAPPRDELVVTSEVEGRGNDTTARMLEAMVTARAEEVLACRVVREGAEEPLRFFQAIVQVRPADGRVKKLTVTSSTGSAEVDACVVDIANSLVWAPPPMFPDKVQLNVTWRAPLPPP